MNSSRYRNTSPGAMASRRIIEEDSDSTIPERSCEKKKSPGAESLECKVTCAAMNSSRYEYISPGAMASRRIIEESSYSTTPERSCERTPICGQRTCHQHDLSKSENVTMIDQKLNAHMKSRSQKPTKRPKGKTDKEFG